MDNWIIRRAEEPDSTLLSACLEAAFAEYVGKGIDLPSVSDGIKEDIRDNVVWVADLEGQIIGGLVLVRFANYSRIANVGVDPSAVGLGIGRALMHQAETEARKLGHEKLKLSTHVDIPDNVSLYEHLGWRETDRTGNKVHMEKALASAQSS